MVDGKGLREGWHSKELWKSVERANAKEAGLADNPNSR